MNPNTSSINQKNNGSAYATDPKEKLRRQVEADADDVISKVGEGKRAFQMSMRFFAYQVAISSFTNIIGTVIGHPLDTIRVKKQLTPGESAMVDINHKAACCATLLSHKLNFLTSEVGEAINLPQSLLKRGWPSSENYSHLLVSDITNARLCVSPV